MENLVKCYFCNRQSDLSCNWCHKALCTRCDKQDHCKYSCEVCKGKDETSKSYILHQVCKVCKEKMPHSTTIVVWDSSEGQITPRVVAKISEFTSSDCLYSDIPLRSPNFIELIDLELQKHANKQEKEIFILSESLSPNIINEIQSLVLRVQTRIYLINLEASKTQQIIPIRYIDCKQLVSFLKTRADQGKLLTGFNKLYASLPLVEDLTELLSDLELSQFNYSDRKLDLYSFKAPFFNQKVLTWVMKGLEEVELIPLFSRIQDILTNLFYLKTTDQEIFSVYKSLQTRTYAFTAANSAGNTEQAISFKSSDSFIQESKSDLESMPTYKDFMKLMHSVPAHGVNGVYKTAVFYFKITKVFQFAEIYKILELLKHSEMAAPVIEPPEMENIEEIKDVISLIIEERNAVHLKELEQVLFNLIKPCIINYNNLGFSGFINLIESSPEFIINEGKVSKCRFYNPALDLECPICFEEMKDSDCKLECSHSFHYECIRDFLGKCKQQRTSLNCPSCRRLLSEADKQKIENNERKAKQEAQKVIEEIKRIETTNRERCLNQSCLSKFQPGQEHLPCRFCNRLYCWECQRQKAMCRCNQSANIECSRCTFIGVYNLMGEYAVCEICENLLCVLCKKSADSCSHHR